MSATTQFLEDEEHITNIQVDTTLQVIIEIDISTQRLPVAIKCTTDQLTVFVQYRAS